MANCILAVILALFITTVNGGDFVLEEIGCYIDTGTRDLEGPYITTTDMTPQKCVRYCNDLQFSYAGVQAGSYCFCGQTYGLHGHDEQGTTCSTACRGDASATCGGTWRNFIYDVMESHIPTIVLDPIGCFIDSGTRDLEGPYISTSDMTPQNCILYCNTNGYNYAGVQYYSYCFCGQNYGAYGEDETGTTCNAACRGDPTQKCGGTWRNFIYRAEGALTDDDASTGRRGPGGQTFNSDLEPIGCYIDTGVRDLEGPYITTSDMTPEKCVRWCNTQEYSYAGLQAGSYCFCGQSYGLHGHDESGATCSTNCRGTTAQTCGGTWRNFIYDVTASHIPTIVLNEIGCFIDTGNRDLEGPYVSTSDMTPENCVMFCQNNNYRYAGTQAGSYCFCGMTYGAHGQDESGDRCTTLCRGSTSQKCGGTWRNFIYDVRDSQTNVDSSTEDRGPGGEGQDAVLEEIGCYIDSSTRDLEGPYISTSDMTPEKCVRRCNNLEYSYAGVQAGSNCYCGQSYGMHGHDESGGTCRTACRGSSSETCGGTWRNFIYDVRASYIPAVVLNELGCFIDTGTRDLEGPYVSTADMTPENCVMFCHKNNFRYAGVQAGSYCFCGQTYGVYGEDESGATCSTLCRGSGAHTCGGTWRNFIYDVRGSQSEDDASTEERGVITDRYSAELEEIGCYIDTGARDLEGPYITTTDMTPEKCVRWCNTQEYSYAGTQAGSYCFCGQSYGAHGEDESGASCSTTCRGASDSTCGGTWRNFIYDVKASYVPTVVLNEIGCFIDTGTRDLEGPYVTTADMTPENCVMFCHKNNFRYAGTQAGSYCFCGQTYGVYGEDETGESCATVCRGSASHRCGGTWRNYIYDVRDSMTRTDATSEDRGPNSRHAAVLDHLGCFIDTSTRDLEGPSVTTTDMTPEKCVRFCDQHEYSFAGVQAGSYCYCGQTYGAYGMDESGGTCSTACRGSNVDTCGGTWRNNIYNVRVSIVPTIVLNEIGCYIDTGVRDLEGPYVSTADMTPEMCVVFCNRNNFRYAGVQAGSYCFCGQTYGLHGRDGTPTRCTTACRGDSTQTCGGTWRNFIYDVRGSQSRLDSTNKERGPRFFRHEATLEHMGCYIDTGTRDLAGPYVTTTDMTPEKCIRWCNTQEYSYAGVQAASYCFCGQSYGSHGEDESGATCNQPCRGSNIFTCGGSWRNNVYDVTASKIPTIVLNEVGCYIDTGARDLEGPYVTTADMTPENCVLYCGRNNFRYAGVQAGSYCFCGQTYGKHGRDGTPTKCTTVCRGDATRTCGGTWRNFIYDVRGSLRRADVTTEERGVEGEFDATLEGVGCYIDTGARDLEGPYIATSDMTPEKCVRWCNLQDYSYAGVQYGYYCFCGQTYGAHGHDESGATCSTACRGGGEDTCGGTWRNYIYDVQASIVPKVVLNEVGCFIDTGVRDLEGPYTSTNDMTPENCILYCHQNNYRYAGVQYGSYCFCGQTYGQHGQDESGATCNTNCRGAMHLKCGGTWRNFIYDVRGALQEGVQPEYKGSNRNIDATLEHIGCYIDAGTRDLEGPHVSTSDMTPEKCVRYCKRNEYRYAGVQYGSYCFCGQSYGAHGQDESGATCNRVCSGSNAEVCGGTWRNNIYDVEASRIPTIELREIGCYIDSGSRDLEGPYVSTADMTPETCVLFCNRNNYRYAGVQAGSYCFCGQNYGAHGRDGTPTKCTTVCRGDASQTCGGSWRNMIYDVSGPADGGDGSDGGDGGDGGAGGGNGGGTGGGDGGDGGDGGAGGGGGGDDDDDEELPADCREYGRYNCDRRNPCNPRCVEDQEFYVASRRNMYVTCGDDGSCIENTCPETQIWYQSIGECQSKALWGVTAEMFTGADASARCGHEKFDCREKNPCAPDRCVTGQHKYPGSGRLRYVQCQGRICEETMCPRGSPFNVDQQDCVSLRG